jgi:hypothetical protein
MSTQSVAICHSQLGWMASAIGVKRMLALSGFMFTLLLLHVHFSTRNKTRGIGLVWRRFGFVQLRPMEGEADALGAVYGGGKPTDRGHHRENPDPTPAVVVLSPLGLPTPWRWIAARV